MEKIFFNLDKIEETAKSVNNSYDDLIVLFQKLNAVISNLNVGEWESKWKDEFMSVYDESWKDEFTLMIVMVEYLKNEIDFIKNTYSEMSQLKAFPKAYYIK